MQNLLRRTGSIRGLCCRVNSAPPRRWPTGFVRRDAPRMNLLYRPCSNRLIPLAYTTTKCMDTEKTETKCRDMEKAETKCMDMEKIETKFMDTEKIETKCMDIKRMKKITKEVENMWCVDPTYPKSSHRDGAIYRNWLVKKEWEGEVDFTNRNETLLEPMMFSEPTENCSYYLGECKLHYPTDMLQVMSLTLVHAPGSSIEMTGPKRGTEMYPPILIEYDLRIKNGGLEEDDMDLIDGAMPCYLRTPSKPVKHRIYGNCGTVDMSLAFIEYAVEATIEVVISDAQRGLSLSLGSLVNIDSSYEEIQLFQGTVDQLSLRRFVVAVPKNTEMILKLKVDNNCAEHCISFKAKQHGCDRQSMKLELCPIAVKVTWSAICDG
ncbi:hypothetical protein PVAP13_5KG412100 [Panicum virgatum]|uniref:DUF6598 domain-containing protein n=1 Tax=Panicum virgatum TaxID=38727 RepID=A0A8T0SKM9_PANVG|nr:hypothetical protein PVAP13_5KG412100 [Panicum virgatum]